MMLLLLTSNHHALHLINAAQTMCRHPSETSKHFVRCIPPAHATCRLSHRRVHSMMAADPFWSTATTYTIQTMALPSLTLQNPSHGSFVHSYSTLPPILSHSRCGDLDDAVGPVLANNHKLIPPKRIHTTTICITSHENINQRSLQSQLRCQTPHHPATLISASVLIVASMNHCCCTSSSFVADFSSFPVTNSS